MTVPQATVRWRKSRRSQTQGACVELGSTGVVRDSKSPAAGMLHVDLAGLLDAVKADSFTR